MAIRHIKDRVARITQGGYAILDVKWKDNGVLIEDSKLFFITEGEVIIKTKEGEVLCREGDMVLIPSGTKHDYYLSGAGFATKYWFHFSVENEAGSIFDRYEIPFKTAVSPEMKEHVKNLFEAVVTHERKGGFSYFGKLGAMLELVEFYMQSSGAEKKEKEKDELECAVRYISENLSSDITLAEIASVACLSPNYFVRKFKAKFGVSPLKYVAMMRMERAKTLLRDKSLSVTEVMTSVGFCDSAHFSKAFKAFAGYSPRAYKQVAIRYDNTIS